MLGSRKVEMSAPPPRGKNYHIHTVKLPNTGTDILDTSTDIGLMFPLAIQGLYKMNGQSSAYNDGCSVYIKDGKTSKVHHKEILCTVRSNKQH